MQAETTRESTQFHQHLCNAIEPTNSSGLGGSAKGNVPSIFEDQFTGRSNCQPSCAAMTAHRTIFKKQRGVESSEIFFAAHTASPLIDREDTTNHTISDPDELVDNYQDKKTVHEQSTSATIQCLHCGSSPVFRGKCSPPDGGTCLLEPCSYLGYQCGDAAEVSPNSHLHRISHRWTTDYERSAPDLQLEAKELPIYMNRSVPSSNFVEHFNTPDISSSKCTTGHSLPPVHPLDHVMSSMITMSSHGSSPESGLRDNPLATQKSFDPIGSDYHRHVDVATFTPPCESTIARDILEQYSDDEDERLSSGGYNMSKSGDDCLIISPTVEPRAPLDNTLIPINLDAVPPLNLTSSAVSEIDPLTSAVALERDALAALQLELDPTITDKFRPRPLMSDPEEPFVASTPLFENIDEMLQQLYPQVMKGTMPYYEHRARLLRNRKKLVWLKSALKAHEESRRQILRKESSYVPRTRRSFR